MIQPRGGGILTTLLMLLTIHASSSFPTFSTDWLRRGIFCCFAEWRASDSSSISERQVLPEIAIGRRDLFRSASSVATLLVLSDAAHAEPPTKPFASLEALLPAARVKRTIDRALELVVLFEESAATDATNTTHNERQSITNQPRDNNLDTQTSIIQELESLLLQPQNYVGSLQLQGVPSRPAQSYLESYRPMAGDLPLQRYLIRNGDVSTWKALKRKEKEQEGTNEIRAALNAYTDVLSFSGNSYFLNVDPQTKSNMVRQDRLPELKQVITSDMGLRYLYRNQVITVMDDARAELEYQLSSRDKGNAVVDIKDLFDLLTKAQKACDQWFSLIDPKDVRLAMETVKSERRAGD